MPPHPKRDPGQPQRLDALLPILVILLLLHMFASARVDGQRRGGPDAPGPVPAPADASRLQGRAGLDPGP